MKFRDRRNLVKDYPKTIKADDIEKFSRPTYSEDDIMNFYYVTMIFIGTLATIGVILYFANEILNLLK